jgi:hypothetical protein
VSVDGRVGAWIQAWQRLEAMQKLKKDHKGRAVQPLPEWYWSLIAEAQICADLAKASEVVGCAAGAVLEEQYSQEQEAKVRIEEMLARCRAGSKEAS